MCLLTTAPILARPIVRLFPSLRLHRDLTNFYIQHCVLAHFTHYEANNFYFSTILVEHTYMYVRFNILILLDLAKAR